ncbi:MAG: hypothetical protein GY932_06770, partial [Arcobacter sp.]|nr:hypothetical protein [Arcobacter sp.]
KNLIDRAPILISPTMDQTYTFSKLISEEYRVLKVNCLGFGKEKLNLVLNGRLIKNNTYNIFKEGNYKLSCSQSPSKIDNISFKVNFK